MFHLHYDTDLNRLADTLAGLLARRDPDDLLVPQTVLVPQAGLQRWLLQRLAERHGVAANLEFLMPAQMVWRVLRACHPELSPHSLFDREVLLWRLLDLLERLPPTEPAVAALVEGDARQLHRFQLATHLAQLFERYQAYRRDLLDAWQHGEDPDDAQAVLWRALLADTSEPPRSRLLGEFLHRHAGEAGGPLPGLPARLFAFGCINVSPDVLRFLGVMGRHAELHFFLPTPCREYWGDVPRRRDPAARLCEQGGGFFDEPLNPLLVSMGGVGRDFVAQVFGYDEIQPDVESFAPDEELPCDTLLHRVQADVINMQAATFDAPAPDADDDSLRIHVCHSPMREVEVLHDRLLDLFQRHADLEPRDVAVMVPDIATYAPCVEAVFGALPAGDPRFIPWTVADRPASQAHVVTGMFLSLLDMPVSRLGLDEVLEVLAVPAVARGLGLADTDFDELAARAQAAGICRDEDAADRQAQGLPAWHEFSWAFGRERLLLGYLLGHDAQDDDELAFGIAPLTDVEGAHVVALGQLLLVQRLLRLWREQARQPHAPARWQHLLNRLLDALVPETAERGEERALESIRGALAGLGEGAARAGCESPLDWRCVRDFLCNRLAETSPHQRFLAGGVSVCSMVPLRNVPFRVICVLGLDARSFPRQDPVDALSRMHADILTDHRRLGDRSVREDDRYLFLQTLMAARDVLHVSYTGINAHDGGRIEPSVLVSELMDVLATGYFTDAEAMREAVVATHPMQPFSRQLFDASDARMFTYRHEWKASAASVAGGGAQRAFVDAEWLCEPAGERIDLDDLQRFFRAPQQYFLRQCVGLAVAGIGDVAADQEPLVDSGLTRAIRERCLLQRLLHDDAEAADASESAQVWSRAHGWLPPLALGERVHEDSFSLVEPQARAWRARRGDAPSQTRAFELELPSGRILEGRLSCLDGAGVVDWIGNADSGKNWMRWWLEALAALAGKQADTGLAFGRDGRKQAMPWAPRLPSVDAAGLLLNELVDIYQQGQTRPLVMPPRSGWTFALDLATRKKPDAFKTLRAARKTWDNERRDPWIAMALRGIEPVDDPRFAELAQSVYGPLCEALQAGERA